LTVEAIEGMQPEVYAIFEGDKALIRSNEPKKVRKPSARRGQENSDEECGVLEPLSEEELAPLMAEQFAMDAILDPVSTFESRLAAMTGSLWEPLLDTEDEEEAEPVAGNTAEAEPKKPRRRRRSKKMAMPTTDELLPGKSAIVEPVEESLTADNLPEDAPVKKTRRRRKPKKEVNAALAEPASESAAAVAPASEVPASETPGAEVVSVEAVVSKPKRKRRRKKKPTQEGELEPVVVQTEPLIPEDQEDDAAEAPEENAELPVKKTKRRRRRKKKPVTGAEAAEAGDEAPVDAEKAIDEPIAEIEEAEVSALDATADAPPKKSKRRRRKKKPTSQVDALNGDEPTLVAETAEPPVVAEPATAAAEGDELPAVKKKRRRRRSNGKKKPTEEEAESEDGPENSD